MINTRIKFNTSDIRIKNYGLIQNIIIDEQGEFIGTKLLINKNKSLNSYVDVFNDFIELGKELYTINTDCINKIGKIHNKNNLPNTSLNSQTSFSLEIKVYSLSLYIYNKNKIKEWDDIIFKFIKTHEVPYIYNSYDNIYQIDKYNLIDFALLSYLICDTYRDRYDDMIKFKNKASRMYIFEYNSIEDYIFHLIDHFNQTESYKKELLLQIEKLEMHGKNNQFLAENVRILDNKKLKFTSNPLISNDTYVENALYYYTEYETIFGLIYRMINMHTFAIHNNAPIIKFCKKCPMIVIGKSHHCQECFNSNDNTRNLKINKEKRKSLLQ